MSPNEIFGVIITLNQPSRMSFGRFKAGGGIAVTPGGRGGGGGLR